MFFNIDKCSLFHLGSNNIRKNYLLDNTLLSTKHIERDLGLFINDKMSFKDHFYFFVKVL